MPSRIPNARLDFFEGGHLFMIQDRAAYPAIIDFLREPFRHLRDDLPGVRR